MKDLKEETINLLKSRGVTIRDIAELTMFCKQISRRLNNRRV